ncbi:MAG: hypothetical protein J0I70_03775 [Microbacterium sp.]|uniref:hypothetical protein n=1 Tax=Microbacterium sp. TaxID=51671 RepID=UPI001AD500B0|nr:hypothetical protein [Microbacterium sp.]MBN9153375.1 hypothetical protein [Microbacterium sp.]MBN9173257.1 hypothetical protein [Microbacterium sp.]
MRLRITTAGTKIATITAWYIGIVVVTLTLGLTTTPVAGYIAAVGLPVAMVWFCTRTFRGDSEDVAPPRAWWRMTERPASGYVLGALFAAQAIAYGIAPASWAEPVVRAAAFTAAAVIAAGYLNSSARLTRGDVRAAD